MRLQWFDDLPTKFKIIGLVSVMAVLLVMVGGMGYYGMNTIYQKHLLPVAWLNGARSDLRAVEALNIELIHSNTSKARAFNLQTEANERMANAEFLLKKYEKAGMDRYEADKYKKIQEELQLYKTSQETVIKAIAEQQLNEAYIIFIRNAAPHISAVNTLLSDLADNSEKSAKDVSVLVSNIVFIITILSSLIALLLGSFISNLIVKPLKTMNMAVQKISAGILTIEKININSKDEIGQISEGFNVMTKNLRELVRRVELSSMAVAASSEELSASAGQSAQVANQVAGSIAEVAEGTEKQRDLVNSTTEVAEQISKEIFQVVDNTKAVSISAGKTENVANDGEQAVIKVVNQMNVIEQKTNAAASVIGELEENSKQIGQIIVAISGIAGQTNLLALNAAIEAARAGEAGRGFAVVADEVRKLAEQSDRSAKQIANLIEEVQQKTSSAVNFIKESKKEVNTGTEVVTIAGQSFRKILMMIKGISSQIQEISTSIQQITSGTQELVSAVREIDVESKNTAEQTQTISAATEEQSASMQEIASSSQALSQMAEELEEAINKFKI